MALLNGISAELGKLFIIQEGEYGTIKRMLFYFCQSRKRKLLYASNIRFGMQIVVLEYKKNIFSQPLLQ